MYLVFPEIRTKIDVYILSPIWNPHTSPIKLIIQIITPPNTELQTSFKIHLIGTIKILPSTNNIHIQDIIISVFIFTQSPLEILVY